MFCSKCGKEIGDDSIFCKNCGNRVENGYKEETQSQKGRDINYKLLITKEEILVGTEKTITINKENNKVDKINIKIPPGIPSGKILRLSGKGNSGLNGGTSGDLYVEIIYSDNNVDNNSRSSNSEFKEETSINKEKSISYIERMLPSPLKFFLILLGMVIFFTIVNGLYHLTDPVETKVPPPPDPLQVLSETPPSQLQPDGELYEIYQLGSDYTDVQRKNREREITGLIVQWTLPVYEVYKKDYGYEITTSGTSGTIFDRKFYVSTEIHIHLRNSSEGIYIEGLKTGDMITFKGKISGVTPTLRYIVIDPSILMLDDKTQTEMNVRQEIRNYMKEPRSDEENNELISIIDKQIKEGKCISGDCFNGKGVLTFLDGKGRYEGSFKNGRYHGQGTLTYTSGDQYTGEFVNNLEHGDGVMYTKYDNSTKRVRGNNGMILDIE